MPEEPGTPKVQEIFYRANFIRDLDIRLDHVSEGICETSLIVHERLLQQHGFVHGGVIATLADHTAGGAARSVSREKDVLTVEFKITTCARRLATIYAAPRPCCAQARP
jgi:acyl-coenzyme A thioesterase PaaI-like protein